LITIHFNFLFCTQYDVSFELPDGNARDLGIAGWENMGMGLSFRGKWEWDRNGNEVIEMGWIWYEKSILTHL